MATLSRRALAAFALVLAVTPAAGQDVARGDSAPPIVFVHGDREGAGFWTTTLWRFESNGYPADFLFAADIDNPAAPTLDTTPEPNRSTTEQAAEAVAATVERALGATGAARVAIVAHGRGCQTARNYVKNFGGAEKVARLVLAGCLSHGAYRNAQDQRDAEFNGAGHFLTGLNAGSEVPEGIPTTVLRSDRFDLYAQPDGRFIGLPGKPTGVSYDAPALAGAENIVLEGVDHRETATAPEAFIAIYKAVTGQPPARLEIEPEAEPQVSGEISGWANGAPTNMPLEGATLSVYAVDPATGERRGEAVLRQTVGPDGRYGPLAADPGQPYEFVVEAAGYPTTRIYRGAFPRSTAIADLRLYPAEAAPVAGRLLSGEVVNMMRPRGDFGIDDNATLDALPVASRPEAEPVPAVWISAVAVTEPQPRTVLGGFDGEVVAARTTPDDSADVAWIELRY
ncbi:hydrolase [Aurantimonas sp. HBX-1]|uniref:hydrolase n=1 Tax=Aurantimonas sp. HBX-1 TaxID=2906072 RepID=UPI001F42EAC5|nr:hydrolase [Aurantimonas sp. HBX-1]UIJ71796.1 hydrolase [Aurantimonas sp. HBX-1]